MSEGLIELALRLSIQRVLREDGRDYSDLTMSEGYRAAVLLYGPDRGRELLGCDWGPEVCVTGENPAMCIREAVRVVSITDPTGQRVVVKLCPEHIRIIDSLSEKADE